MITRKEKDALNEWIEENARRYWLHKGGPLRPPSEGGADIIIVCSISSLEILAYRF
jgi:hypothetical protein